MPSFSFPFSDGDQDQEDLRRRPQRPVHTRGRQELLRTVWKGKKDRQEEGKMERWNFSNRAEKGDIGCLTLKGCHNECASRLLTHLCCFGGAPKYDILWRVPYSACTGNGPCSSRRRKEYNGRTDKAGHIFLLLAALLAQIGEVKGVL